MEYPGVVYETTSSTAEVKRAKSARVGRFIVQCVLGIALAVPMSLGVDAYSVQQPGENPQRDEEVSTYASWVFGEEITAQCENLEVAAEHGADGWNEVRYPTLAVNYVAYEVGGDAIIPGEIHLREDLCDALIGAASGELPPLSKDVIYALHVVNHERYHTHGLFNEAKTECAALSTTPSFIYNAYPTPETAEALENMYYPRQKKYQEKPPEYQSYKCVVGGEYDATPNGAIVSWVPGFY